VDGTIDCGQVLRESSPLTRLGVVLTTQLSSYQATPPIDTPFAGINFEARPPFHTISMSSLVTLPTEIILEVVRHLNVPPWNLIPRFKRFHPRKDSLALASTNKRMRDIIFEKQWITEHMMVYSYEDLAKSAELIKLSMRRKVK
jgi:hypothetical protein